MTKKNVIKIISEYLFIAIGAVIAAFSIEEFLVPNLILDGGVVGIGIIVSTFTPVPLSALTLVLNIPFLLIGSRRLGKKFIIKSAYAMAVFSAFLRVFEDIQDATSEPLLAVSFGGVILGIGVGLVIRNGGCLDGTETVAIILNKKFGFGVGQIVLCFNVIIYSCAGFLFGPDRAMFSLLTYFITSKVIDMVESGIDSAKAVTIITNDAEEIAEKIYRKLGRTVTITDARGLVSGEKKMIYCVITSLEIWELKHIIETIDESAFITVSEVSEIIGVHMKSSQKAGIINSSAEKITQNDVPEDRSAVPSEKADEGI